MQAVLDKLKDNLQIIYRKSIDADQALDQLQKAGKGKHQSIFADDAGFNVSSKRFAPYVQELATNIQELESSEGKLDEHGLAVAVKKIELLLVTLANFHQSIKS